MIEESSPAVLGVLLEGFDAGAHPRDFRGRWRKGDKVHVVTPQGHVDRGVVEKPAETYNAITSRGSERSTTVQVRWEDGDVTHERPGDIQAGHPARSLPTSRRATLGKAEGDAAARTRAEILAKSPGAAADLARYQSIGQAARAGALPSQRPEGRGQVRPTGQKFDSIGAAARAGQLPSQQRRSDPSVTHASLTRQLENLPGGRYHSLPGLGNGGSLARKTKAGIEVYRALKATPEKVHKTPSAAAGHMMRIRNEGVVREAAPEVLGALLEGR